MHHHDDTTNKCICEQRTNVWTSCLIISSQFQVSLTKHYAPREKCKVLTLTHFLWQATENYYYKENKKYFSKDIAVHCKIKNLFYFFLEFSLVLTVIIFNLFLFYQKNINFNLNSSFRNKSNLCIYYRAYGFSSPLSWF